MLPHRSHSNMDPAHETQSGADTTPESRINYNAQVSDDTKKRVRSVDPNDGRCLVENCPETRAVDFCHCFPRSLTNKDDLVRIF